MPHRLELAHLVLEVPDPSILDEAFGHVVGLLPGAPSPAGAATWRNDGRANRVIVRGGRANDAVAVGFAATHAAAFDDVVASLGAAGVEVVDDAALASERRVGRLARVDAPWGGTVELVLDQAAAPDPYGNPNVRGGFLTEGVGFGHVVLATTAFADSVAFLTDGLGLVQSDWLETELAPGITHEVRFFHCNARHHTVALAKAPFELPQVLHHVMFEMCERDDVGAAFDRLWATEIGIPNGLGRHDNDGMFSFYLATPAGFQVEVGHGARVVGDDWDDDRRYDAISAWGHQPLRP
jgi:2,3-dihydroxybiphenyl 1,2-dioxygenase